MDTRTLEWNWRGKTIRLGADANGSGPNVLLLPALSSISSRREMRPLQERLAPRYSTLAVDWPGFGEAARPQVDWTPEAYTAFLAFPEVSARFVSGAPSTDSRVAFASTAPWRYPRGDV